MPMDFDARERERLEMAQRRPATAQEIASHLPRWAQELMLDPDASEEYEEAQVTARAAELHASRVADRTWEEDGEGGDVAGMGSFTASELAEDYRLPLETVCEQLLELGVASDRLDISRPVRTFCSASQQTGLLEILGAADPIAAREARVEESLAELAEDTAFSVEQLLVLCQREGIRTVSPTCTCPCPWCMHVLIPTRGSAS